MSEKSIIHAKQNIILKTEQKVSLQKVYLPKETSQVSVSLLWLPSSPQRALPLSPEISLPADITFPGTPGIPLANGPFLKDAFPYYRQAMPWVPKPIMSPSACIWGYQLP